MNGNLGVYQKMAKQRDFEQITTHQHCRLYPLDGYITMNVCKMSSTQAGRIRDMSLSDLQQQEFVSPEEFAYITGRTYKAAKNIMDRNESLLIKEYATPDATRPKRFIRLQHYWAAIINNKASLTPREHLFINEIRNNKTLYREMMKINLKIREGREVSKKKPRYSHQS
ncbi:TPA: hypothetical protein N6Q14_003871, partial [Escherichia coli]|nr:hypothetical protein [Escherichia coli]